ncbi:MAG: hypothetical protein ACC645_09755, partial [Pirellulales bacterium]
DQYATVFLLDKKYYHYAKDLPQANCDYALYLRRTGEHQRQITAYLGFGDSSAAYTSQEVELEPQRWYHGWGSLVPAQHGSYRFISLYEPAHARGLTTSSP